VAGRGFGCGALAGVTAGAVLAGAVLAGAVVGGGEPLDAVCRWTPGPGGGEKTVVALAVRAPPLARCLRGTVVVVVVVGGGGSAPCEIRSFRWSDGGSMYSTGGIRLGWGDGKGV
jgi:hypothetical protein